jgi:hypothetical protein
MSFEELLAAVLAKTSGEHDFLRAQLAALPAQTSGEQDFLQDAADSCSSHRQHVSRISFRTQLAAVLVTGTS